MKLKTFMIETLYFVLNLLLIYPVGFIIHAAAFAEEPDWQGFIVVAPLILVYVISRAVRQVTHPFKIFTLFVLCFAMCTAWVLYISSLEIVVTCVIAALSGGLSIVLFLGTRRYSSDTAMTRFAIGCTLYLGMGIAATASKLDYYNPFNAVAIILFILLSIFILNSMTLVQSLYIDNGDSVEGKLPSGMRQGNIFLLLVFTGIFMIFILFDQIRQFFEWIWASITGTIGAAIMAALEAMTRQGPASDTPMFEQEQFSEFYERSTGDDSLFFKILIYTAVTIFVIAAIIFLVLAIRAFIRKLKVLFKGLLEYLSDAARQGRREGFEDHTEELFDWSVIRRRQTERMKAFMRRSKPKARFADQKTNRDKVRFTYKTLLERAVVSRPKAVAMTPEELAAERLPINVERHRLADFAAVYNAARYSESEVTESAVTKARTVYDELGGR